jgi:hypothetical protein
VAVDLSESEAALSETTDAGVAAVLVLVAVGELSGVLALPTLTSESDTTNSRSDVCSEYWDDRDVADEGVAASSSSRELTDLSLSSIGLSWGE